MDAIKYSRLAVPAVVSLICLLAYSSQYLFRHIDPGPLNGQESLLFNGLVICVWICYARACLIDPGHIRADLNAEDEDRTITRDTGVSSRRRRCRKCQADKPPRSHHCKICARCIPKMDHHCPWTMNCVSHFTFPHFFRFLFYAVTSISYLEYLLYLRAAVLWHNRNMPSYLGPSAPSMALLLILFSVNTLTLFLVSITFIRSAWCLFVNTTTIEGWEIERHNQLLKRARVLGGYLDGPDGKRIRIVRQEFPYDIGIWRNITQGMGTSNPILWFWPLAGTRHDPGLAFEVNDFEDPDTTWPPPDPDRMPRQNNLVQAQKAFTYQHGNLSPAEEIAAFNARQQKDFARKIDQSNLIRRRPFHERFAENQRAITDSSHAMWTRNEHEHGEEGWRDSDGNRLDDFGLDMVEEFYDEDDVPLSKLLKRKKDGITVSKDE